MLVNVLTIENGDVRLLAIGSDDDNLPLYTVEADGTIQSQAPQTWPNMARWMPYATILSRTSFLAPNNADSDDLARRYGMGLSPRVRRNRKHVGGHV